VVKAVAGNPAGWKIHLESAYLQVVVDGQIMDLSNGE
jgi:hypothetical protein